MAIADAYSKFACCVSNCILQPELFYTIFAAENYLLIHTIIEGASITVSFCVFVVVFYAYKQSRNSRDLFIGAIFLIVGLVDFAHTMSYYGMPDFFIPNTENKASVFWIIGRMIAAGGILGAIFIPPPGKKPLAAACPLIPARDIWLLRANILYPYQPRQLSRHVY